MNDEYYMQAAIELARRGGGWVNPNPLVGAVIVRDDKIIGRGWHARCGELHAERNAFADAREDCTGATLYVTLEPCCHTGKTPPCTDAVIENGIARVVVGSSDPNPRVSGGGVRRLREAGIEVVEGVLKEECDELNQIFFHWISTGRPYVMAKYAMSADGRIAPEPGVCHWLTGEQAVADVHHLRDRFQAILVGIQTVLVDDPQLNCRIEGGKDPLRVIVDTHARLPLDSKIARSASTVPTLVFTAASEQACEPLKACGIDVVRCEAVDGAIDLNVVVDELARREIDSLIIEGGPSVHASAFDAGIVNAVCVYVASSLIGSTAGPGPIADIAASGVSLQLHSVCSVGSDVRIDYEVTH